jgi:hypothetical protein
MSFLERDGLRYMEKKIETFREIPDHLFTHADNVACTNCEASGLVTIGREDCPNCGATGTLSWIEGKCQEEAI